MRRLKMRCCKPSFHVRKPSLRGRIAAIGCACALAAVLASCGQGRGAAASNASASTGGNVSQTTQPSSLPANASQGDQPSGDVNAADLANSIETPDERARANAMLAQKNADCVDQLIKSQPFGESREQIIDNVTKGCLPIATWEAQSSPSPPANVEQSERAFVSGEAHALIDGPAPSGAAQQPAAPPPPPPANETATPPLANAARS